MCIVPLAGGSVSKLSLHLSEWRAGVRGKLDRGYRHFLFRSNRCEKHDLCRLIVPVLQACIVHLTGPSALQIIYCIESAADPLTAARPVNIYTKEEPVHSKLPLTSLSRCLSVSRCTPPPSPGPPWNPVWREAWDTGWCTPTLPWPERWTPATRMFPGSLSVG